MPQTVDILTRQGLEPVRETPAHFAQRLQGDDATYKKIIEEIGLVAPTKA